MLYDAQSYNGESSRFGSITDLLDLSHGCDPIQELRTGLRSRINYVRISKNNLRVQCNRVTRFSDVPMEHLQLSWLNIFPIPI